MCWGNQTHISCSIFFFSKILEIMWKKYRMLETGRPQMTIWHMRIACWEPKPTNTHSQYAILIAFPLQQWLNERASMLRLSRQCRSCSWSSRGSEFILRSVLLLFYCGRWQLYEEGRDGWCWFKMSLDVKRKHSEWWSAMRRNGYYIVCGKKRPKLNAEMGLPHRTAEETQRETATGGRVRVGDGGEW
jgi:hypothetical protein